MKIDQNRKYAVFTGDIVKSSKLSINEHALVLKTLDETVRSFPKMHLPSTKEKIQWIGPTISQGDTWQVLTNLTDYVLLTTFYISACLKH